MHILSIDVSNVSKTLKYQHSETFHTNEFEKRKRYKLCKFIHHKLKHIRKCTIYECTGSNKTNAFKLYLLPINEWLSRSRNVLLHSLQHLLIDFSLRH